MQETETTHKFGIYLDITTRAIKQDILRRFKEHKITLTPEQWAILNILGTTDQVSQKDLADSTFKDPPTVSRIIDILDSKELLLRVQHPQDRRRFIISLTDKGRELLNRSTPIVIEARTSGWKGLNENDYLELKRILDKIYENVNSD